MSVEIIHKCDNPKCPNESETRDLPNSGWITAAGLRVADSRIYIHSVESVDGGTWCRWECLAMWAMEQSRLKKDNEAMANQPLPF